MGEKVIVYGKPLETHVQQRIEAGFHPKGDSLWEKR